MTNLATRALDPRGALLVGTAGASLKLLGWQWFFGSAALLYVSLCCAFLLERRDKASPLPWQLAAAYLAGVVAYAFVPFVEVFRFLDKPTPYGWAMGTWLIFALLSWIPILALSLPASGRPMSRRFVPIAFAALGTLDVLWLSASI